MSLDPALLWTCGVGECWNLGRTYGDLVGVLFSDLLDLFAAISCGEREEDVSFWLKQQENTKSRISWSRSAPVRHHMTSEEPAELC